MHNSLQFLHCGKIENEVFEMVLKSDAKKEFFQNVTTSITWKKMYDDALTNASIQLSRKYGRNVSKSEITETIFGAMLIGSNFFGTMELYHRKEAEGFKILRENAEMREALAKEVRGSASLMEAIEALR